MPWRTGPADGLLPMTSATDGRPLARQEFVSSLSATAAQKGRGSDVHPHAPSTPIAPHAPVQPRAVVPPPAGPVPTAPWSPALPSRGAPLRSPEARQRVVSPARCAFTSTGGTTAVKRVALKIQREEGMQESDAMEQLPNGAEQRDTGTDHVVLVSLGCMCGPKLAFKHLGRGAETLPFDWMRTRSRGLLRFLRNDFEGFFTFNDVVKVPNSKMTAYRGPDHSFWHDDPTDPGMHERYIRRIERFKNLAVSSNPTLFVRVAACTDEIWEMEELLSTLRLMFGNNASLLFIMDLQQKVTGPITLQDHKSNLLVYFNPVTDLEQAGPYAEAVACALNWLAGDQTEVTPFQSIATLAKFIQPHHIGMIGSGSIPAFYQHALAQNASPQRACQMQTTPSPAVPKERDSALDVVAASGKPLHRDPKEVSAPSTAVSTRSSSPGTRVEHPLPQPLVTRTTDQNPDLGMSWQIQSSSPPAGKPLHRNPQQVSPPSTAVLVTRTTDQNPELAGVWNNVSMLSQLPRRSEEVLTSDGAIAEFTFKMEKAAVKNDTSEFASEIQYLTAYIHNQEKRQEELIEHVRVARSSFAETFQKYQHFKAELAARRCGFLA